MHNPGIKLSTNVARVCGPARSLCNSLILWSLDGKIVCPRDASHQSCVQFPSHCLCRKEFRNLSTLHIACLAEVRRPKTLSLNPSWKRQKALQPWQHHDRGMELLGCFQALIQQGCKAQWVQNCTGILLRYVWQIQTEYQLFKRLLRRHLVPI